MLCVVNCDGPLTTLLTETSTSLGCGDVADISANGGTTAPEGDCNIACSGDFSHLCGGTQRLQLYLWDGTLNNWHYPSVIGEYKVRTILSMRARAYVPHVYATQYLITAPIPAIVATLGINSKVSFLEKFGNSEIRHSTGAYELDTSLAYTEPDRAWRTMHTLTNTWCSAALVLADKAARVLNIAGWDLDASQGLRLYAPDGSPGVNGTNDWEETPKVFKLQVRWRIHSHSICKVLVLNQIHQTVPTLVSNCVNSG